MMNRREFLVASAATAALSRLTSVVPTDVTIVQFSDTGERQGITRVPKVEKSKDEWQKQLSEIAYYVARERGTETPFTGEYWNLHERGLFRCICCDNALFRSADKFDSRTGWPSFTAPIAEENVLHGRPSRGYTDSEVTCVRCDAHLGDLFDDGPDPTGLRYCIDSVSLRFVKF